MFNKTGFEPGSSEFGSDRAVNCAGTTAHDFHVDLTVGLNR